MGGGGHLQPAAPKSCVHSRTGHSSGYSSDIAACTHADSCGRLRDTNTMRRSHSIAVNSTTSDAGLNRASSGDRGICPHKHAHTHTHGQQHEHRDIPQGGGYASEPSCGDNSFPALGPLQSGDKRLRATQRVQSAQRSQHTTWARAGNLHAVGCRQQLLSTHLVKDVSTSRW